MSAFPSHAMPTDDPATIYKPATPRCTSPTPMRSLAHLFRTPTMTSRRAKRARPRTSSVSSGAGTTAAMSPTPLASSTPSLPPVVLQTYSVSTDSIVLTALPSVPFCCHEDLLTMSRTQLEGVVRALNARLPHRMRIGPEAEIDFWCPDGEEGDADDGVSRMSETEMRRRVEELVGIRAVVGKNRVARSGLGLGTRAHTRVPPAPKAVRTRDAMWRPYETNPWEMVVDALDEQSDDVSVTIDDTFMGSSPLAGRTTLPWGRNDALSRLAILQEENEGDDSIEDNDEEDDEIRPSKRQRVALGDADKSQNYETEAQVIQKARYSRLVENMDLSGSPLFAKEPLSDNDHSVRSNEMDTSTVNDADTLKEDVEVPLERRRSTRIREMALRRARSVGTGKEAALTTRDLKSSILRPTTFCSRRSSSATEKSLVEEDPGAPKEITIRLPFTSTPAKSNVSAWSASRILRSHSQRLLRSNQATKAETSLGRSASERYPRARDMTFVTIDRPRYRFSTRKSKGEMLTKGIQGSRPQGIQVDTEPKRENKDPKWVPGNPAIGVLNMNQLAVCNITSRSRAPSTSSVASIQGNNSDSPARTLMREGTGSIKIADAVAGDGAAVHVWEALGRMVVGGSE